jgi:hypothetical protein
MLLKRIMSKSSAQWNSTSFGLPHLPTFDLQEKFAKKVGAIMIGFEGVHSKVQQG